MRRFILTFDGLEGLEDIGMKTDPLVLTPIRHFADLVALVPNQIDLAQERELQRLLVSVLLRVPLGPYFLIISLAKRKNCSRAEAVFGNAP
jgi:hypothetical protein